MEPDKTPPWKSLLFALAGAYGVFCCIYLSDRAVLDAFDTVVFGIWGVCFWAGGTGNLFVDRRAASERGSLDG